MEVTPARRRSPFAAVLVAVALTVSACTSNDAPPDPSANARERLFAATEATRGAGTARIEEHVVMSFPRTDADVASGSITVDAEGVLDLRGRRGRLSVTTTGEGLAGADALAGDMEMILSGDAMYMSSPFLQQLAPRHERWLRVSFEELGLRGMAQLGQQDPLAFVEILRGVYGDVVDAGRETVRGADTTHFRSTVDIERLVESLPRGAGDSVRASFGQLGVRSMPVDVWLDEQGRMRRLSSDLELSGEQVEGGRMEMSVELYDFGVAFDLEIPPDDEVAEFSDVFGEIGG